MDEFDGDALLLYLELVCGGFQWSELKLEVAHHHLA
jgi:hypothetical protein